MKFSKNAAAVEAPPYQPFPVFEIFAVSGLMSSQWKSKIGSLHACSWTYCEDLRRVSTNSSLFEKYPAHFSPNATTQAPVNVAKSMIIFGLYFSWV